MRVLMMADESFATRERDLLGRVEVGLLGEGVRIFRASPSLATPVPPAGVSEALVYEAASRGDAWLNMVGGSKLFGPAARANQLERELVARALISAEAPLDIVHAWGERCWPIAAHTASLTGARLALEMWSVDLVKKIEPFERHNKRLLNESAMCIASSAPIMDALTAAGVSDRSAQATWGVHAVDAPGAWSEPDRPIAIVMLSSGRDPATLITALEGLAVACADRAALVFLDAAAMRDHRRVWSALKSLDLLGSISLIPDMEGRRELVLRGDVFVAPEASGELRSITLDAMAAGMTIIANPGAACSDLLSEDRALLIEQPDAGAWSDAFKVVFKESQRARQIGRTAHVFIRSERPVSRHITMLKSAYDALAGDEAIPFSPMSAGEA